MRPWQCGSTTSRPRDNTMWLGVVDYVVENYYGGGT
eukprot:COSAG05_NODE_15785_length_361_cov_0.744275_1_plen_35_part_10